MDSTQALGRRCWVLAAVVVVGALSSLGGVAAQDPNAAPDPNQGNPCSIQWYEAHGWLMWLAFGVFFPVGILVARYGQYYFRQWFYTHIALQVTGVILSTIAVAIAINKFQVIPLDGTHVRLGVAIMVLVWLQPLLSLARPKRGSGIRPVWYVGHWLLGTTAVVLAWFNIFKGLDLYQQNWAGGERKAWYVLFGLNVAILAFIYLFLDRLPHIRSQSQDPSIVNPNLRNDIPLGSHDTRGEMKRPAMDGGGAANYV